MFFCHLGVKSLTLNKESLLFITEHCMLSKDRKEHVPVRLFNLPAKLEKLEVSRSPLHDRTEQKEPRPETRVANKVKIRQHKYFSNGGKGVLAKAYTQAIPSNSTECFKLPKGVMISENVE